MLPTNVNERPRYYARQLVTPDDLTLEQNYFRAKLRRHNRYLHGWGVVCGAEVVAAQKPWMVIVKQGYVLGPYGDEMFIPRDVCIDVRTKCTPASPVDDECVEVQPEPPQAGERHFIAVRYVENKTRLIRVPLGGCGCEDNSCEYSRFADGYEICVIDGDCPPSHQNPPDDDPLPQDRKSPACPECETTPWVILSTFTVDENGAVTLLLCECRRQVLGFGSFWGSCDAGGERVPPQDGADARPPAPPANPTRPTNTAPPANRAPAAVGLATAPARTVKKPAAARKRRT